MKRAVLAMLVVLVCSPLAWADILHSDDVIIDGSLCVGFDCVNGESFGFDTIRLKENNLRIRAQDTSNSSSFPSNDWQITFNDSSNGGANKFSIDDIDSGKTPFTIEAGAPSHSLYVDDAGRLGLGTSTPVVDVHTRSGNTPTLRLEQDGSSGFTPQTWDVAGNEANFFIRDVTNGSTLPFRIRPGAPSSSIDVAADGDVGIGTSSPGARLHIDSKTGESALLVNASDLIVTEAGDVGIGTTNPQRQLDVSSGEVRLDSADNNDGTRLEFLGSNTGRNFFLGNQFNVDNGFEITPSTSDGGATFTTPAFVVLGTGNVGIGTSAPTVALEVVGDILASGNITPSDARFKTKVTQLHNMVEKLEQIRGVSFEWKDEAASLGHSSGQRDVGVIAQEVESVFPELVTTVGNDAYKAVYYGKFTGVLIEAVKELHAENVAQRQHITTLEARLEALEQAVETRGALAQLSLFNLPGGWILLGGLSLAGLWMGKRWKKPGA